jgi:hypothetical protein
MGMTARDYSKFLNEEGKLNVALLPPPTYTALLVAYRQDPSVIREVFDELWFLWDLQRREEQAGPDADIAAIAQSIIDEMEEEDFLRVRAAFEQRLINRFGDDPARWAAILDPVYDEHQRDGWG